MRVAIPCGSCGRPLRLAQALLGGVVRCPLCFATFEAAADQATPLPDEPPPPAAVVENKPPKRLFEAEPEEEQATTLATVSLVPEPVVAARRKSHGPMVRFSAFLSKDPDRTLKGLWEAEADEDGLRLRRDRNADILVPVGHGNARFLGGNQLTISAQGREVVLTLLLTGTDQVRLARDLADYLNNERGPLNSADYAVPGRLSLLALLPLGVPLIALSTGLRSQNALGKLVWCVLGLALAGLCLWLLRRGAWTVRQRVQYGGLLGGLSYGTLLVGLLLSRLFPYAVDPSQWHPSAPGEAGYRVQFPGPDRSSVRFYGWWGNFNVVESRPTGMDFAVGLLDAPSRDEQSLSQESFFEGRKAAYLSRNVGSRSIWARLRPGGMPPCYDFVGRYKDSAHGDGVFVARLVRVDDQVYLVAVAGPRVSEDHPDVKKFLDSFVLDGGRSLQGVPLPFDPDKPISGPEDLPGLLLHFSFDESDERMRQKGGRFQDGASADAAGVRGMGLQTRRGYFSFAREDRGDLRDTLTIVGWLRTAAKSGCVLSLTSDGPRSGVLSLELQRGLLFAEVRNNKLNNDALRLDGGEVSDLAWHHFALVRVDADHFQLYVDGVFQDADVQKGLFLSATRGCLGINAAKFQEGHLDAVFDDVALFNRVLTAEEIARLAKLP
jgi:hypothetical protein